MCFKQYIEKGETYLEYAYPIGRKIAEEQATDGLNDKALVKDSESSHARMQRVAKTYMPDNAEPIGELENTKPQIGLVLSEGWCGDAA